jgi:hypothetical protein
MPSSSKKLYKRRVNAAIARRRFKKDALEALKVQASNLAKYKALVQKRDRQARSSKRDENDEPPINLLAPPRASMASRAWARSVNTNWRRRREEKARRQYL